MSNRQYFPSSFPLWIAEVRQEALGEHSHEFFEMVYVRRGRGRHIIEGVAHPIQAGDLYVINPDEKHGYAPAADDTLRLVNILWQPALVEDLLRAQCHSLFASDEADCAAVECDQSAGESAPLLYVEPLLRGETRFAHRLHLSGRNALRVEILIDEMRREQSANAQGGQLLLRHLFCALLVLLSRAWSEQEAARGHRQSSQSLGRDGSRNARTDGKSVVPGRGDVVARAVEYLEEHHARALRVSDVAAHASISPSRLSHVFKAQLGRGVNEYLHELRIARACSMLLESDTSIGDIASVVGYNDARFFHRVFRRYTGCNPTQYRRHFANGKNS